MADSSVRPSSVPPCCRRQLRPVVTSANLFLFSTPLLPELVELAQYVVTVKLPQPRVWITGSGKRGETEGNRGVSEPGCCTKRKPRVALLWVADWGRREDVETMKWGELDAGVDIRTNHRVTL